MRGARRGEPRRGRRFLPRQGHRPRGDRARRRRWWRALPTIWRRRESRCSDPPRPPPSSRAPRASPRTSAPSSAFPPRPTRASRTGRRRSPTSPGSRVPIVVKADGLAAGKGVTVAETREAADRRCRAMLLRRLRRGRRRGGDRGMPGRRGGELLRARRRRPRASSRRRAGPQARLRRRAGPQHGRHGRLLAGAGDDAGHGPPHDGRDHLADGEGHGGARHPVQGRAVRRA